MAFDDLISRLGDNQESTSNSTEHEASSEVQLLAATAMSSIQRRKLPIEIMHVLHGRIWSIIPFRQAPLFRYHSQAQFWILASKRWQRVNYSSFSHHSGERYAFVPYQSLDVKDKLTSYGGGNRSAQDFNSLVQADMPRGLSQAEINRALLGGSKAIKSEVVLEPTVFISNPNNNSKVELKRSQQVYMRFSDHMFRAGDTVESVANQYAGRPDPKLIYGYNDQVNRNNSPKAGDRLRVPSGWDTKVGGSVSNARAVRLQWQGPSKGSAVLDVPKLPPDQLHFWDTRLKLDPGVYVLTASAGSANHSIDVEVLGVKSSAAWIKVRAYYDDEWQTALPLEQVNIHLGNTLIHGKLKLNSSGDKSTDANALERAESTANEAGVVVKSDLPQEGQVTVEVARNEALEAEINNLKSSLHMQLDGAYRDTVSNMSGFQSDWDEYGFAAIAINGAQGAYQGGSKWLEDQADLFEAQTWIDLGKTIKSVAGSAYDTTADYASERFEQLRQSANEMSNWIEEDASEDLLSWNWYQANTQRALDAAEQAYRDVHHDTTQYLNDAADVIKNTSHYANALYTHRHAITNLLDDIAKGEVAKVQQFVDTTLVDIDPELAASIKNTPDFYLVLALIDDHDSALTYVAYASLFMEAVPPNFYAYIGGKGGAYVAIEVCLLLATSLLTLGAGTAARVTALAAKLSANGARAASTSVKVKKAQAAISAFIRTLEDFNDSTTTLKKLGKKLTTARSSGLLLKGKTNSTLTAKKQTTKRQTRCRLCGKTDHTTPRSLRGIVHYE
ncbi:hypothetical protein [Pseudoalteromonas sp. XMcav11-Q]|uniref:hypothetical protein n=1 Tax=Pseudoalteromonas sp. XMcav11-Q TaxID=3136665 RepID=UPI0032C47C5F